MILKLLPSGKAWRKEEGSDLHTYCTPMSREFARIEQRAYDLVEEADPRTADECLEDWERVFGLPDPCVEDPDSLTIEQRRNAILAKMRGQGGQTLAYFEEVAESLGYDVECSNYDAFRAGASSAGDPLTNDGWTFWFEVYALEGAASTTTYFRAGSGSAGDPLVLYDQNQLECVINRLKPAHTNAYYVYDEE